MTLYASKLFCMYTLVMNKVGTNYKEYCNNVNCCQQRFIVVSITIFGLVILKIDYEQYSAKTIRYQR